MSESDLPEPVGAEADNGGNGIDLINPIEASYWWRSTVPAGALLNKLMLLFIAAPVLLVLKSFYALSFVIFVLSVPYGLLLRHWAVRAVRRHLQDHPEDREHFAQVGIISS